jgi:tetratricopeptide (TPR) repeat protein
MPKRSAEPQVDSKVVVFVPVQVAIPGEASWLRQRRCVSGLCKDMYSDQGDLAEAEKMYQRALQGYEKALGAYHTSTLDTVHILGNLYSDQGDLAEAEKMYHELARI